MAKDIVFTRVEDTDRWATWFDELYARHSGEIVLRKQQTGLDQETLYASNTWGTLFAISADGELTHLVSAEHQHKKALVVALCNRRIRLWAVVEAPSPAIKFLCSCGFGIVALTGLHDESQWAPHPVYLMASVPSVGPVACCETMEQFKLYERAVAAWADDSSASSHDAPVLAAQLCLIPVAERLSAQPAYLGADGRYYSGLRPSLAWMDLVSAILGFMVCVSMALCVIFNSLSIFAVTSITAANLMMFAFSCYRLRTWWINRPSHRIIGTIVGQMGTGKTYAYSAANQTRKQEAEK